MLALCVIVHTYFFTCKSSLYCLLLRNIQSFMKSVITVLFCNWCYLTYCNTLKQLLVLYFCLNLIGYIPLRIIIEYQSSVLYTRFFLGPLKATLDVRDQNIRYSVMIVVYILTARILLEFFKLLCRDSYWCVV